MTTRTTTTEQTKRDSGSLYRENSTNDAEIKASPSATGRDSIPPRSENCAENAKTKDETKPAKYAPHSSRCEDFINDAEIRDTLEYAETHKHDKALADSILTKAADHKGLTHREAAVLLISEVPDVDERIRKLAREIKETYYGRRVVFFAPLYLSNYCVNGCVYCPYHAENDHIPRRKLTQDQIRREVTALQDMGHKRLAIELGEDPKAAPLEYVLESIDTIYSVRHRNGSIRRVNVNIAATTTEDYRRLKDADIGTYILFQETYNKEKYTLLHPAGPKSDYARQTEAMDRAMDGGIDDVGLGVLFGLDLYKYDFTGLLMHAEHLEAAKGVGPHTISVPRIRPADGIDVENFNDAVPDRIFERIVALIRVAVPYTGMIMSTRESAGMRAEALELGISQLSGASKTSVGGYDDSGEAAARAEDTAQFDIDDRRTLDEVVSWLTDKEYIPSFCTACYREGRTGDRFMSLVKSGKLADICQPNALMTFGEYLEDYARPSTRAKGMKLIEKELSKIQSDAVRARAAGYLSELSNGKRDFRF
jgi:2-iminoacetate synthase